MSGEWPDGSISLDVGFSQVAEALGDGALLESATPETLLAVAFAAGDSSRLLKITPMEFVGEWESAIDDRAGLEDVGRPSDNAHINASVAANTTAQAENQKIATSKQTASYEQRCALFYDTVRAPRSWDRILEF